MLDTVTGVELDRQLIECSGGVVLLVFSAPYLGESRMLDGIIEEIADGDNSGIIFFRINVDTDAEVAAEKGVYQVPTVMIYADSELVYHRVGLQGKSMLKRVLNNAVSNTQRMRMS